MSHSVVGRCAKPFFQPRQLYPNHFGSGIVSSKVIMKNYNNGLATLWVLVTILCISLGAQWEIRLPWSPIPLVLSDFFILLAAFSLPRKLVLISIAGYLFVGGIGAPVFAGGGRGWNHLFGTSGGYLWGFFLAGWWISYWMHNRRKTWKLELWAWLGAIICIFVPGIVWLSLQTELSLQQAFHRGCWVFAPGFLTKGAVAILLSRWLRRAIVFKKKKK